LTGRFGVAAGGLGLLERLLELEAALLDGLLDAQLVGLVAEDLEQPDDLARVVAHRRHDAAAPEARAVLADMPALVAGAAGGDRGRRLALRGAGCAILGREDEVGAVAEHLALGVPEDGLGPAVPALDAPRGVHREDRVFPRVLDDQAQPRLARGERRPRRACAA
jgi:hypothetical protein